MYTIRKQDKVKSIDESINYLKIMTKYPCVEVGYDSDTASESSQMKQTKFSSNKSYFHFPNRQDTKSEIFNLISSRKLVTFMQYNSKKLKERN